MAEKCICCGEPILSYPCKFCGQSPAIDDSCPWKRGAMCLETKHICPKKGSQYFNCEVFRGRK